MMFLFLQVKPPPPTAQMQIQVNIRKLDIAVDKLAKSKGCSFQTTKARGKADKVVLVKRETVKAAK